MVRSWNGETAGERQKERSEGEAGREKQEERSKKRGAVREKEQEGSSKREAERAGKGVGKKKRRGGLLRGMLTPGIQAAHPIRDKPLFCRVSWATVNQESGLLRKGGLPGGLGDSALPLALAHHVVPRKKSGQGLGCITVELYCHWGTKYLRTLETGWMHPADCC